MPTREETDAWHVAELMAIVAKKVLARRSNAVKEQEERVFEELEKLFAAQDEMDGAIDLLTTTMVNAERHRDQMRLAMHREIF